MRCSAGDATGKRDRTIVDSAGARLPALREVSARAGISRHFIRRIVTDAAAKEVESMALPNVDPPESPLAGAGETQDPIATSASQYPASAFAIF
jgi:hypothetical protein